MTHIRTFLEAAAPAPSSEFDVRLLAAPRPRRRRLLGWLAAIAGGLAAVGVTSAGFAPASRVEADRPAIDAPAELLTPAQPPEAARVVPPGPLSLHAGAPTAPGSGVAAKITQGGTTPEALPLLVGSEPAASDGCEVREEGSCSYIASSEGGYVARGPNWTISIETGGFTYVFSSAIDDLCGDVGFIEPGDKVTLTAGRFAEEPAWPPTAVPNSSPHAGPSAIRAGPTAHCGAQPPG